MGYEEILKYFYDGVTIEEKNMKNSGVYRTEGEDIIE